LNVLDLDVGPRLAQNHRLSPHRELDSQRQGCAGFEPAEDLVAELGFLI